MREAIAKIKAYFDPHITTKYEDWLHLEKHIRIEKYKNRHTIKSAGTAEGCLRFILTGGGVLLVKHGDKEICLDICFENNFITDHASLMTGESSDIYIKNFLTMEVVLIERDVLMRFYNISSVCSTVGRVLAEQKAKKIHQIHMVHQGSIEERYSRMEKEYGGNINRIPQKFLASYLGVSPQSLSRIRGRRKLG